MVCGDESDGSSDWPLLAYGNDHRMGSLVCYSKPSGVVCNNDNNDHGFGLSRSDWDTL